MRTLLISNELDFQWTAGVSNVPTRLLPDLFGTCAIFSVYNYHTLREDTQL